METPEQCGNFEQISNILLVFTLSKYLPASSYIWDLGQAYLLVIAVYLSQMESLNTLREASIL